MSYSCYCSSIWKLIIERETAGQSTAREIAFGNMLGDVLEILKKLEIDAEHRQKGASRADLNSHRDRPTKDLMAHLIDSQSRAVRQIYDELVATLWDKQWKPERGCRPIHKADDERFRNAILRACAFKESTIREDAIAPAYRDTFSWVYLSGPPLLAGKPLWSSFPMWLETDTNEPFWITGKPGSGKSTLMKLVQKHPQLWRHLHPWAKGLPVIIVNYYAWIAGAQLQKSHEGLMRTILHACLSESPDLIPEVATRRWALFTALQSCSNQPEWQEWELQECLNSVLEKVTVRQTKKMLFFIDGLDEFDEPPLKTVKLVQQMSNWPGLKICVASRQWSEFNDALYGSPMIRMQDLTSQDLALFVDDRLSGNRAFAELTKIHPRETQILLSDIAGKANGVFLWLSLVVKTFVERLSEGDGLQELRQVLDALPDKIESLYGFIWASIKSQNHSSSAQVLSLTRAALGPLEYLTFWLADTNLTQTQLEQVAEPLSPTARTGIHEVVIRRLDSKTRGIVEVSRSGIVDFHHRTARDWMAQPAVWTSICSSLPDDFDPNLRLCHAETLRLQERSQEGVSVKLIAIDVLKYAVRVEINESNNSKLTQILEGFDTTVKALCTKRSSITSASEPWYRYISRKAESLPAVGAQFCLLPYLHYILERGDSLRKSLLSNMLESAVLALFTSDHIIIESVGVATDHRVRTVSLLMKTGNISGRGLSSPRSLGKQLESRLQVAKNEEERTYWREMVRLLMTGKKRFWLF